MNDKPTIPPDGTPSPDRDRLRQTLATGGDDTAPAFLYSTTHASLLLAIESDIIDAVGLARAELASRGLDANGVWCGFDRAREIHLGSAAAEHAEPEADTAADRAAAEVARRVLHLNDLDTRNSDALDFHEIAVWQIKEALAAAFAAGRAAAR